MSSSLHVEQLLIDDFSILSTSLTGAENRTRHKNNKIISRDHGIYLVLYLVAVIRALQTDLLRRIMVSRASGPS